MSNVPAIFSNETRAKKYMADLYELASDIGSFDGNPLLRLTEDGEFIFGEDATPLYENDALAINPASFKRGWVCFTDKNDLATTENDEVADFLFPLDDCPDEDEIYRLHPLPQPKHGRGRGLEYRSQLSCEMTIVDGDNKGTTLTYKPTSTGGKRMIAKLAAEIARAYDDSDSFVPVVELYSSPYHNRRWNKRIFNPFADIIDWRTLEDSEFSRPGESGDTKTDAKKPARKRGGKDAAQDNAPARGRKPARSRDAVDVDEDGNVMPNDDADEKPARGRGRPRKDDAAPARGRGRSKTDKLYDDARESLRGRGREDAAEPEEEEEEEASEPARTRGRGRGREEASEPARTRGRGRGREEASEPARSGPRGAGRARGRR
ncbi:MAG: hypothetical protein P8Y47_05765 [Alphaproteobacteria bacterium]